jgi:regulator of sigma E protease
MPTGLAAIFWGVITFSVLVVLHEGGHFLAARAFGVKVHEFMLGLPGPALRWRSKRSGVSYGVTAIPLGGYVRIAGMEPGPEDVLLGRAMGILADRGSIDASDLASDLDIDHDRAFALVTTLEDYVAAESVDDGPGSRSLIERAEGEDDEALLARVRSSVYRGQAAWKRVVILAMGVLVNLVTAVLIFTLVLTLFGEQQVSPTSAVGSVVAKGPAAAAGIVPGDVVVGIGGTPVTGWAQLQKLVRAYKPGTSVVVLVARGGTDRTLTVVLGPRTDGTAGGFLGVAPSVVAQRMALLPALGKSVSFIGLTFAAIADFFNPAKFAVSVSNARSVVGISYEVARAAEAGPFEYAAMMALLSLSLGVINILPIPPLDGGKVAVEIAEALIRRPIPRRVSLALSGVGAVLLFSLIFYLMYADVMHYVIAGS